LPFVYWLGKRFRHHAITLAVATALWYCAQRFWVGTEIIGLGYAPWFFMGTAAYFQSSRNRFSRHAYYGALALVVGLPLAWAAVIGSRGFNIVELACCAAF